MRVNLQQEFVSCGVCGSDRWHPYASGQDYEYGTSTDIFQIVQCRHCGHRYLNPRPVMAELPPHLSPPLLRLHLRSSHSPPRLAGQGLA